MELVVADCTDYGNVVKNPRYLYSSMQFCELNRNKVDDVRYLVFKERKYKAALAVGIAGENIQIPFSAPFSMFEKQSDTIHIEEADEILKLLDSYAEDNKIKKIRFRLPPAFYDENLISKLQNGFLRNGYRILYCDLNYAFRIKEFGEYREHIYRNARKNLNTAMRNEYRFCECVTVEEKKKAYDIIAVNRMQKGYPLRMSWEQVRDTMEITEHECFVLSLESADIAAAVVFRVTDQIWQVIYWGDISGYSQFRPMNYLSYRIFEHYYNKGIGILDIGPSTEEGIPNFGLCDFKESIGCFVQTKNTFEKVFGE